MKRIVGFILWYLDNFYTTMSEENRLYKVVDSIYEYIYGDI